MLDKNTIRNNPELVRISCILKKCNPCLVDEFLELDICHRGDIEYSDAIRSEINSLSKKKPNAQEIEYIKNLKIILSTIESFMKKDEERLNSILLNIPNIPHESVPRSELDEFRVKCYEDSKEQRLEIRNNLELYKNKYGV